MEECFSPSWTRNLQTSTLANSEDPDEMPHHAAFHQGLHCLLLQSQSSETYTIFGEIITCDPLRYTMDHPDFVIHVCSFMETFTGLKQGSYRQV